MPPSCHENCECIACALRRLAFDQGGCSRIAGRYIVVGGGLAGLMTVIKLAEAGKLVDVFSIVPLKRSHSICAQGGIKRRRQHQGRKRPPGMGVPFNRTAEGPSVEFGDLQSLAKPNVASEPRHYD